MRAFLRPGLFGMVAGGMLAAASTASGQAPPAGRSAAPARPAILDQVIATVNGEKVTRGELLDFLSRYQIPPDHQDQVYRDAVDTLINMRLISQFLSRQNIPVSESRVDGAIADLEQQLKADGSSLAAALVESNKSMADVRKEYANRIRWIEYVKQKATDAELKKFVATHKDLLNNTQVKASHILLKVDPKATPAEKERVRQKMLGIKRDIDAKKYTFAEAANKFSEDPANADGLGGDIGYFGLNGGIVEEFGKVAFAMKPGQVSDPVETPYGDHLILVSDRKEGPPIDFEQNRPMILNAYAAELQKDLLIAQRKAAKIDIKPMPADLFPPQPPPQPTADSAPQPKGAGAAQPR